MERNSRARTLAGFERLLLLFGVLLLFTYLAARFYGAFYSRVELQRFWESQKSESEAGIGNTSRADPRQPDFRLWSEKRIAAYKTSLASRVPFPLAVLKIPAIRLEVPVLPGTDDLTLNRAVGHIDGSALPGTSGNVGIAGHRDGFFRGLKDIHVGDVITLATQNGTDHYLVDEILIVSPEEVSVLQPRATSSLTLVTCYPFYFVGSAPERYIVHASIANSSGGVGPGETRHFLEKGGDQER